MEKKCVQLWIINNVENNAGKEQSKVERLKHGLTFFFDLRMVIMIQRDSRKCKVN